MRAVLSVALVVSASLVACTQDSAASNAERDTHMGSIRAVATSPNDSGEPEKPLATPPTPMAVPSSVAANVPAVASAAAGGSANPAAETPPKKKKP